MSARNKRPAKFEGSLTSYHVVPNSPILRWMPKRIVAVAWGDAVHLREDRADPALLAHEGTHVLQMRRAGGPIRGALQWIWLLMQYGYEQHPWEREARAVEAKVRSYTAKRRAPAAVIQDSLLSRPIVQTV